MKMRGCRWSMARVALAVAAAAAVGAVQADQDTATAGQSAVVRLDFEVNVYKFVLLRVGAGDASTATVDFRVGLTPDLGPGNSQAYAGAIPGLTTRASTTNPVSAAGSVDVQMFTNVAGTQLTCSIGALAGAAPFVAGAAAGGVPGRSNILVTTAGGVAHPGGNIGACGTSTAAVAALTNFSGTYTYSTNFVPATLAAGTYGNVVTYTLTAP